MNERLLFAIRIIRNSRLRQLAAALLQGLAQQIFDLRIGAAQFLRRHALYLGPQDGIDTQGEGFFTRASHCSVIVKDRKASIVKRTGIDDGLRLLVGAQDHQQIADHGRLALIIEMHDVALG